ncbi:ABC transporter permease [Plantibacter sp. YIM 135249]|uniref:ABC transporter permease n=1 Tax=Plantibacter sp. YIM 135249 TaxID=3423918 RepID=UPI003D33255C
MSTPINELQADVAGTVPASAAGAGAAASGLARPGGPSGPAGPGGPSGPSGPAGPAALAPAGRRRGLFGRFGRIQITLVLAWLVIAIALAWAIAPGLFTSFDPLTGVPAEKLQGPSAAHWFGTDSIGRDLLARVIHGSVNSLSGALIAVTVGLVVGTVIGVLAGSNGGLLDDILMRVVDVLLSIPGLLLSLSIIILLGFGTTNAAIAVGVTSVASFARLSRSEVVRVRRSEYVEAAFGSGGSYLAVLARHVLPNSLTAVIGLAALQFGTAILAISTLGFLGYGAPPPTPEWGLLIAEGRNYIATSWWLTVLPGLVVVAVVLSANRISQSIGKQR